MDLVGTHRVHVLNSTSWHHFNINEYIVTAKLSGSVPAMIMAPNTRDRGLSPDNNEHSKEVENSTGLDDKYKMQLAWGSIVKLFLLHLAGIYGGYLWIFKMKWQSAIFTYLIALTFGFGVTAGAHRLWSHRSYKAKLPFRILLMILNSGACQDSVIFWARDHRVHHKYTETNADPYNAARGMFFAHIGWLLVKKHPDVTRKGKGIDISDMEADPVLRFQHKYYTILSLITGFILPMAMTVHYFGESWWDVFFVVLARYLLSLHYAWLVNSVAHKWGSKPYDTNIFAVENKTVSLLTGGEGFHNYHHAFPWDYKASELTNIRLNFTTVLINFFSKIGWAYDLKTVSDDFIRQRVAKTGPQSP